MGWLVTGAHGMLGTDAVRTLEARGLDHTALGRGDLDLLDAEAVSRALAGHAVVLNCAAYTDVDGAETHEDEAHEANAVVPGVLARAARAQGTKLVHVSTDYVFAGRASTPYDEDAPADPRSAYGRTKAGGEAAVRAAGGDHLVVRTAWLYGAHGPCFPQTIARLARERGAVSVVDDQVGQPTWTVDVADLVVRLVEAGVAGTWHATSTGGTSWFEFARHVVGSAGLDPEVVSATSSASFVRPAPRPAYSVLGHEKLLAHGIEPIGPWEERWQAAASAVLTH